MPAYEQRIPIRFPDVDFARVVYYPRFFDYCHQVFEDFFTAKVGVPYAQMLSQQKVGYPSVHASADFKKPLRFGDTARIVMTAFKISEGSVGCEYRVYRGDSEDLCATVKVISASISMDTFTPTPLPANVRAAFEAIASVQ